MRLVSPVLAGALVFAAAIVLGPSPAASAATDPGTFVPLAPSRILDTRSGTGGTTGPVHNGQTVTVSSGHLVPGSSAVLSITAIGPTAPGFLRAGPAGATSLATVLNFSAGISITASAVVQVADSGAVEVTLQSGGTTQLAIDLTGYYVGGAPTGPGAFAAVPARRVLDTRNGTGGTTGPVSAGRAVAVPVTSGTGVPSTATAAVVSVTATTPTANGYLRAAASQASVAQTAVNYSARQSISALSVIPMSGPKVYLTAYGSGTVQMVVDVVGYFTAGAPQTVGAYGALTPVRALDTRSGTGAPRGPVRSGAAVTLTLAGHGGVPVSAASAAVVGLSVVTPQAAGFLQVAAAGSSAKATVINFAAGQSVSMLAVVPLGANGAITLTQSSGGTAQLTADVSGFVLKSALTVPASTVSRYVQNITDGGSTDVATMDGEGCEDAGAIASSGLVILDIGAQTKKNLPAPGVLLTGGGDVRMTDAQLASALTGYVQGATRCLPSGASMNVAVATNSDGSWPDTAPSDPNRYSAQDRGTNWANQVIAPLQSAAQGSGVTVSGADDIEAAFSGSLTDVQGWETAYLAADSGNLYFIGAASACPTSFGVTRTSCGEIQDDNGKPKNWTQENYYGLIHSSSRIVAVPQIYNDLNAVQWANIVAGHGTGAIVGALTEQGACTQSPDSTCPSLAPDQGYLALDLALLGVSSTTDVDYATDIRYDYPATSHRRFGRGRPGAARLEAVPPEDRWCRVRCCAVRRDVIGPQGRPAQDGQVVARAVLLVHVPAFLRRDVRRFAGRSRTRPPARPEREEVAHAEHREDHGGQRDHRAVHVVLGGRDHRVPRTERQAADRAASRAGP